MKNNKFIIILNVIMLLVVTGLSAYAYQKQKDYNSQKVEINKTPVDNTKNNQITLITSTTTSFHNENDLNKKYEIFKKFINDKNEIVKSSDEEIRTKYKDAVSHMKDELKKTINNTIKDNTLDSQSLEDSQKVENSKNKLEELKTFVTKNGIDIFEEEEKVNTILADIDNALNNNVAPQSVVTQEQASSTPQETQSENQVNQAAQQQVTPRAQTTRRTTQNSNVSNTVRNNSSSSNQGNNTTSTPAPATPTTEQ